LSIFTVIRDGAGHEMSIGAWIARCRSLPQYRGHGRSKIVLGDR
jgi:hypothetical protein